MYVFGCLRHRFGFGPDLSIFSFNSIHLVKKLTKSNQSDPNIFLISPKSSPRQWTTENTKAFELARAAQARMLKAIFVSAINQLLIGY